MQKKLPPIEFDDLEELFENSLPSASSGGGGGGAAGGGAPVMIQNTFILFCRKRKNLFAYFQILREPIISIS